MGEVMISRSESPDELYHWGVLGMKWGVRRYQNKDGSLTRAGSRRYGSKDGALTKSGKKHYEKDTAKLKAERKVLKAKARTQKKMDKLKDLKDEVDDLNKADKEAKTGESREEKRKRLLESTDAKDIYENRNLLTTAELNDRINRIDTEARLASKIPEQKTGLDYVNQKMNRASNTVNNVTNMFQKVDNAYSTVSKSAVGKVLSKKLGIETPKKEFNLDDFWENRNTKTNQEMQDARQRILNEKIIEQEYNRRKENSGNKTNNANNSNESTKSSNTASNSSNNSGSNSNTNSNSRSESSKVFTGTVEGEGTSRFRGFGNDFVDNNPTWKDVTTKSTEYADVARIGSQYIAGYLTYNEKKK